MLHKDYIKVFAHIVSEITDNIERWRLQARLRDIGKREISEFDSDTFDYLVQQLLLNNETEET
jgi:hypothetical protein